MKLIRRVVFILITLVVGPAAEAQTAATCEGYLVAHGELRALPIGSSLDPKGTFYWP